MPKSLREALRGYLNEHAEKSKPDPCRCYRCIDARAAMDAPDAEAALEELYVGGGDGRPELWIDDDILFWNGDVIAGCENRPHLTKWLKSREDQS